MARQLCVYLPVDESVCATHARRLRRSKQVSGSLCSPGGAVIASALSEL